MINIFKAIKETIENIIANINFARIGVGLIIKDPWLRREAESEMDMRQIEYVPGFNEDDSTYMYAITGGNKAALDDFLGWCITHDNLSFQVGKHQTFKTKLVMLKF